MNLQPLGDRLIVEVLEEEETTASGIVLPDTAKEKPQRGRVLAVGPGPRDEDGEHITMDLEPDDERLSGDEKRDRCEEPAIGARGRKCRKIVRVVSTHARMAPSQSVTPSARASDSHNRSAAGLRALPSISRIVMPRSSRCVIAPESSVGAIAR